MFKKRRGRFAYGVIGLERFGLELAAELSKTGADLLLLDTDADAVTEARDLTPDALILDNIDERSLLETGIQNCDVVVVTLTEHVDSSILATLLLINMGVPKVVSKAANVMHGKILQKLGAEVVFPEHDMAVRLATKLGNSHLMDVVSLSEQINMSKLKVPAGLVGKSVKEVDLRNTFHLNIIAIETQAGVLDNVEPTYCFAEGDILYLVGKLDNLELLDKFDSDNK